MLGIRCETEGDVPRVRAGDSSHGTMWALRDSGHLHEGPVPVRGSGCFPEKSAAWSPPHTSLALIHWATAWANAVASLCTSPPDASHVVLSVTPIASGATGTAPTNLPHPRLATPTLW